jgi:hypothetical protein
MMPTDVATNIANHQYQRNISHGPSHVLPGNDNYVRISPYFFPCPLPHDHWRLLGRELSSSWLVKLTINHQLLLCDIPNDKINK